MSLSLADYEKRTRRAVSYFWKSRRGAGKAQLSRGIADAGSRGSVTAGKNMEGFIPLIEALLMENGLPDAIVQQSSKVKLLPGFFRATKSWDYVVTHKGRLIAALEMKSQVGSFGNNFNNRCEESIGSAVDFQTAYREGAFGKNSRPFLGYLMLVEDSPGSRRKIKQASSFFPAFPEFEDCSYIERYQLLCQKLVSENLYNAAAVIASPTDSKSGKYVECCENTGMKSLVSGLAAAIAVASTVS